jgi:sigma-B regulation protein RsbU (phosphoserine phosphatase)
MSQSASTENLSPEHLLTLYEITAAINSSLEFDEALNNIIDSVMAVTKAQRGFVVVADDHRDELRVLAARGVDGATLAEEGYSTTIVSQVMQTRAALLTNNAQFDTRYQPGQSIIMRGLRAILCVPLITRKGDVLGAIYVDTSMKSGIFSQADRDLLSAVAGQAAITLENARLYTVAVEKGRLERELQMASEIQQSLLPRYVPDVGCYEIAAGWQAAREVAGDFYDLFPLENDKFGVVIADVSDKGAPAALFMAVARTMIRAHSFSGSNPVETMSRTNDLILEDADSGMFVTVYHSVFSLDGHSVHVNAGHNPPILYRSATRDVQFMPRGGRAIGWFPNNPLQATELQLEPGDILVYYTDGLTESQNALDDFYGDERLAKEVVRIEQNSPGQNARWIMSALLDRVAQFRGEIPPHDDQTIVVIRYLG